MKNDIAIKAENISKKYCKSLKGSMFYGIKDIGRNMLGLSSHSERLRPKEFWALDDISFQVKKGETLGIIGPNGAGKTTLLKLLNGIFWPDKGKITVSGKVGALIEVGAGFHPLLTGRENIYVNAAILGMTKKEVDGRYNSIVEFADIDDFINTPVKFYSSGMFVRLGFAVAVHCEPDILLVDEVLSVGDWQFQRKCIERIKELKRKGIAIVLVSHNLHTIEGTCDRTIALDSGKMIFKGVPRDVVLSYQSQVSKNFKDRVIWRGDSLEEQEKNDIVVNSILFSNSHGEHKNSFHTNESMKVLISLNCQKKLKHPVLGFHIRRSDGLICATERSKFHNLKIAELYGDMEFQISFEKVQLIAGEYEFVFIVYDRTLTYPYVISRYHYFTIKDFMPISQGEMMSVFHPKLRWERIE